MRMPVPANHKRLLPSSAKKLASRLRASQAKEKSCFNTQTKRNKSASLSHSASSTTSHICNRRRRMTKIMTYLIIRGIQKSNTWQSQVKVLTPLCLKLRMDTSTNTLIRISIQMSFISKDRTLNSILSTLIIGQEKNKQLCIFAFRLSSSKNSWSSK